MTRQPISSSYVRMAGSSEYTRIYSWLIGTHHQTPSADNISEYFRNMFPPSDNTAMHGEKLVNLECDSEDFALLLALINKTPEDDSDTWEDLSSVLQVGKRYHFIHIPDLVRRAASNCLDGTNATAIFQFAAARGYPDLAKYAIVKFAESKFNNHEPKNVPLYFYDKIAPRYAAALVDAMSQYPLNRNSDRHKRWQNISLAFKVSD